jgi:hypothetical protein
LECIFGDWHYLSGDESDVGSIEHASLSSFLPRQNIPPSAIGPSILSLIPTTTAICYDGQSWVNRIITMSAAKQVYIAVIGSFYIIRMKHPVD